MIIKNKKVVTLKDLDISGCFVFLDNLDKVYMKLYDPYQCTKTLIVNLNEGFIIEEYPDQDVICVEIEAYII